MDSLWVKNGDKAELMVKVPKDNDEKDLLWLVLTKNGYRVPYPEWRRVLYG